MKKLITIALLAAMLLTCFAGCGLKQGSVSAVNGAENVAYDATTAGVSTALKNAVTNYVAGTAWDGTTIDTEWNTAEGDAEIADAADLAQFVAMINAGKTFAGKTITLTADINLGGHAWTAGKADFAGTFDGGNHVISNYKITQPVKSSGFFCNLAAGAIFKNVALIGGEYTAKADFFGYAFGKATAGATEITVQNIYVDATLTTTVSKNGYGLIGVGTGEGAAAINISNIEINGTVNCTANTIGRYGSAIGDNNTDCNVTISDSINNLDYNGSATYVGGFVGRFNSGGNLTITNCQNNGDIKTTGNGAGGIVGYGQAGLTLTVENCSNTGDISVGEKWGSAIVAYAKEATIVIKNCYAAGTVDGGDQAGGVAGYITSAVNTFTMEGCEFAGTFNAKTQAGGVAGYICAKAITIKDCKLSGTVNGDRSVGGVIGFANPGDAATKVVEIDNCDVTATGKVNLNMAAAKNTSSGGIIGRVRCPEITIKNCDFEGALHGTFAVDHTDSVVIGGLVGVLFDTAEANNTATISDCAIGGTYRFLDNRPDPVAPATEKSTNTYIAAKVVGDTTWNGSYKPTITYSNVTCTSTLGEAVTGEKGTLMTPVEYGHTSRVIGYQTTAPAGGKYNLRIASTLGLNGLNADDVKVGFQVTINYWDAAAAEGAGAVAALVTDKATYATYAYPSMVGGDTTYNASDYHKAEYLYAFVLENIPEGTSIEAGTLQIVITPIIANNEGVVIASAPVTTIGATPAAPAA